MIIITVIVIVVKTVAFFVIVFTVTTFTVAVVVSTDQRGILCLPWPVSVLYETAEYTG